VSLFLAMWPSLLEGVAKIDPSGFWNLEGGTLAASHSRLIRLSIGVPMGSLTRRLSVDPPEYMGSLGSRCAANGSSLAVVLKRRLRVLVVGVPQLWEENDGPE